MKILYILLMASAIACSSDEQATQSTKTSDQTLVPYSEVYDNGQTRIQGNLLDGKRHGLWLSFYEDGVKWSEDEYFQGERNGKTISYYPTGIFRYKGVYIDDEPAGKWTFYDEEGKVDKEEDFSKK